MTSIPGNVQNYLSGNRTEQTRIQSAEPREEFGKVLDRQMTESESPENAKSVKTQEQYQTAEDIDTVKNAEDVEPVDDVAVVQDEEPEKAVEIPETDIIQGFVTEFKVQPADDEWPVNEPRIEDLTAKKVAPEDLEEVMEVLQSAIQQIQQTLMQQLDLTPEQLEQIMQDEGITDVQLLDPEIINQLILDTAGAEEPMALVMDEKLYTTQQVVTQNCQEILQDMKKQLEGQEHKLPEAIQSLADSKHEELQQQTIPVSNKTDMENGGKQNSQEGSQDHNRSQNVTQQIVFQNYTAQVQTVSQNGIQGENNTLTYMDVPDSRQITDQILDYIKVSMKPENTVLDMQLHPESLGTLHIQISAKEGIMTAHFTASSEAVKTVLENQIVALKENFLQQDIKVEAIEVTVETHQFESNLEQGRERGGEPAERKPKRRKLDMNSLESGEELTETEQIITDMMAANGNSVDYLA